MPRGDAPDLGFDHRLPNWVAWAAVLLVVVVLYSGIGASSGASRAPLPREGAQAHMMGSSTGPHMSATASSARSGSADTPRASCAPVGPSGACPLVRNAPRPSGAHGGNSSPVGEMGGVVATVTAGIRAYGATFDPANGYVYVANEGGGNLTVLDGNRPVTSIKVGFGPTGAIYDPSNGLLYVANYYGNNVTVVNGTNVESWITDASFDGPYGGAFSPSTGYVYIANSNGGVVTVINGLKVVTAVTVGHYPMAIAYDPADHNVYVTNTATVANGGSTVSEINKTTVVATISGSFTNPSGIAYDPANGYLYVGNKNLSSPTHSFVTVIANGSQVLTTFRVGTDIFGMTYDPGNRFVYAVSSDNDLGTFGRNNLTAINGTTILGNITVGTDSYFAAYDPLAGGLYVTNSYPGTVSIISTLLALGPVTSAPTGNPAYSSDAGQLVTFNSTLWAVGAGSNLPSVEASPAPGLGCGNPAITFERAGGNFTVSCTPTQPGNYTLWLNVTDAASRTVSAWAAWQVYADPNASMPVATVAGPLTVTSVDVTQVVTLSVRIGTGSGLATPVAWSGLPPGTCASQPPASVNATLTCRFPIVANLSVSARVTDDNGVSAMSPILHLDVNPTLEVGAPIPSLAMVDVGQSVRFSAPVSGGSRPYAAFAWGGLAGASCSALDTVGPTCTFGSAGIQSIDVTVTDASGIVSGPGPALSFQVDPALTVAAPTANHTGADVGQSILFSVSANGGSGQYSFVWTGIPSNCQDTRTAAVACPMTTVGTVSVKVSVTDSNGVTVAPTSAATVSVVPATVVGAISISPGTVPAGAPVSIAVAVAGGAGNDRFTWIGLPTGCASRDASQFTCSPSESGVFSIAVDVVDANGFLALGNTTTLTVTPAASGGTTIAGLSPPELYGLIAGVAVLVAAVALVLVRRNRSSRGSG